MDNMEEGQTNSNHILIMNKLGDIQTSLAVNTNETANMKKDVGEIKTDVRENVKQAKETNGRVTRLEDWSKEAQKIIENTTKIASDTANNYKTDKTRIWSAVGVLLFLGGTIITLAIMAINSKIKEGIDNALSGKYIIENVQNNNSN
jgi:hypothetical protein